MAESEQHFMSPGDREGIQRIIEKVQRLVQEDPIQPTRDPEGYNKNKNIYVAVPPCGQGIPGRVGDKPGYNDCCLFQIIRFEEDENEVQLVPIKGGNENARARVYNVHETAVPDARPPDEFYLEVFRDNYGQWICEAPEGLKAVQDARDEAVTSTTTSTSTTFAPCHGQCKWEATSILDWELVTDECSLTTTTSTTTGAPTSSTSTTSSTTTADPCLCPTTSTTTQEPTTSTTSTTTPAPCKCVYPDFCPADEDDCTYTYCQSGESERKVECSTTTTTTCDCNTTTTAEPRDCEWVMTPTGPVQRGDCDSDCEPPVGMPLLDPCEIFVTGCGTTGPAPPLIPCHGECIFWWIPEWDRWILFSSSCYTNVQYLEDFFVPCTCVSPSEPGGDVCAPSPPTPCQTLPTTTLPPDCNADCYTSTTTTTLGPCDAYCFWRWVPEENAYWANIEDNCPDQCPCHPPAIEGHESCEVQRTKCTEGTTTTSTTTTTTTTTPAPTTTTTCAPCGVAPDCNVTYQWTGGAWALTSNRCDFGACAAGGYMAGPAPELDGTQCECVDVPCHTTTTTCAPCAGPDCTDGMHECYTCIDGTWERTGGSCDPPFVDADPPSGTCNEASQCEIECVGCYTTTTSTTTPNPCSPTSCDLTCYEGFWTPDVGGPCGSQGPGCYCTGPGGENFMTPCTPESATLEGTCQTTPAP